MSTILQDTGPEVGVGELRDFYNPEDFSEAEVAIELERITTEMKPEWEWFDEAGFEPFEDDKDIWNAVNGAAGVSAKQLTRLEPARGITPIMKLRNEYPGYSLPYVRPSAHHVIEYIGAEWAVDHGADQVGEWFLSATSLVRSTAYQHKIAAQARKPAVSPDGDKHSSHEYGFAFDLDACGLYVDRGNGFEGIHPRMDGYEEHKPKVDESRAKLRGILDNLVGRDVIHVVEEVPGTQQWVFHVCVNPLMTSSDILYGLPIPR